MRSTLHGSGLTQEQVAELVSTVERLAASLGVSFGSIQLRFADSRWVHYTTEVSGRPQDLLDDAVGGPTLRSHK